MLINNAGFGSMGEFSKLDLARELNMIDLNIKALVELTYRFLQPMLEASREKSSTLLRRRHFSQCLSWQPTLLRKHSSFRFQKRSGRRIGLMELK